MRGRGHLLLPLAIAAAALSGCQTLARRPPLPGPTVPPAPPATVVRRVPPPEAATPAAPAKSCVPRTLGPPPRYPDSDGALRSAAGAADRYQLMAAGRILRQQRLQDLEKVIAGCR